MLTPISTVRAETIVKEINTEGSSPLLILANDAESYFAKTTVSSVPFVEVINEVLAAYFAQCWSLAVPPFALVHISQSLVDNYRSEKASLSSRYDACTFDEQIFFGSRLVACQVEIDDYFSGPYHQSQMHYFNNPLDLLKIGVFDQWIGNFDRKPDNPNILLAECNDGLLAFSPIDHTAAFGYVSNHREVREELLYREPKKWLLSHDFVRAIAKFTPPETISDLQANILAGMEVALDTMDFVFDQIPKSWGFSEKARNHLKSFLGNQERNERIASIYLSYLK
ncbi:MULTISPECIES: HipA family kinase [unclassified Spirosoma]|uniref:HipA family kinase n=1 Tax=unclassified Spirosoma TaxID=2621999 RepID=UPI00095952A6|nr:MULTISPECIES: HipA family kinase [unclassified Spirosoma]MBN8821924.1 hypothetical protein [Spirosoma sp.]OJW80598.1 MAG: hypothetical protein BGO59_34570 [Spirosoma sp. 48-14]